MNNSKESQTSILTVEVQEKKEEVMAKEMPSAEPQKPFPIVGIGVKEQT